MTKSNLQEELRKQIKPVNCVLALDTVYRESGDQGAFGIRGHEPLALAAIDRADL